jgi:hypothetical protein
MKMWDRGVLRDMTPDEIADWQAAQAAPQPAPSKITRTQGLIALFLARGITEAMVTAAIAAIEDPTEREIARLRFHAADWHRESPFIAWGAAQFGLGPSAVDDLFRLAAAQ